MTDASLPQATPPKAKSRFDRMLNRIERIGNALPHPATIFGILAVTVVLVSFITHLAGVRAVNPADGKTVAPFNLLGAEGLVYMFVNVVKNFITFPPFGIVLVCTVGIGIAEGTGLLEVIIRQTIVKAPRRFVTSAVITAGILSHLASEIGYVVLIPLGAMIFSAFKRHPIVGIAAAFAGVSGGFGANFLIGSIDPVLSGLTESAAAIVQPGISINPAANYYFMLASGVLLVVVGTFVTEKVIEPRFGEYHAPHEEIKEVTPQERRALFWSMMTMLFVAVGLAALTIPEGGLLRGDGDVFKGPFFQGMITAIVLLFALPGLVYGIMTGKIKNDRHVIDLITKSIRGIGPYIVLVFFAAQFIEWFKVSNLGMILAIKGAGLIQSSGISGVVLIFIFVLISALLNFFMGSASAKWAIMAPVFVPMFMLSGYHPALTQAAFRIGDSVTNIVTPMMSYFALILTFINKYDKNAGIGTTIATMIPYTIFFFVTWTALLLLWFVLGLPLGPGAPVLM